MIEKLFARLAVLTDEGGQTMAEYAVILGVITVVAVAAVTLLSNNITGALNAVAGRI